MGLSFAANYFEVPLISSSVIYHVKRKVPFSAYGENCFILAQNLLIVGLIWHYGNVKFATKALLSALFVVVSGELAQRTHCVTCLWSRHPMLQ